jgi:hypothetical protein
MYINYMKSKEEILLEHERIGYFPNDDCIKVEKAKLAMDKYAKELAINFLMWKGKKGYYVLGGVSNHTTIDDLIWIRQENQLIFSKPISTNQLFQLYLNENKVLKNET